MSRYIVKFEKAAVKQLGKLDNSVQKIIKKYIEKNLQNTENPREYGKALTGNKKGFWRYRVGDYRIIAEIDDEKLIIIAIDIRHRSKVYD